jgi:hypothetical protein
MNNFQYPTNKAYHIYFDDRQTLMKAVLLINAW